MNLADSIALRSALLVQKARGACVLLKTVSEARH
jgi:hypothetical protein